MTSRRLSAASAALVICHCLAGPGTSAVSPHGQRDRAERGASLIEQARVARGGETRLRQVKAFRLHEPGVVTTVLLPDLYRLEMAAPFGTITTIFDGTDLLQRWPAAAPSVPKPDPTRTRAGARATLAGLTMIYLTQPGPLGRVTPRAAGRQTWGPVAGEVVRFQTASASDDAAWGLVLGADMRPVALLTPSRTSPTGPAAGYSLTVLSDYREVSGVHFPFQTQLHRVDRGGRVIQTLPPKRLDRLDVNPRISRADLVAR